MGEMKSARENALEAWRDDDARDIPLDAYNLVGEAFAAGWDARSSCEVSPAPLEYQPMPGMTGITENYHMLGRPDETVIITPDGKHRFALDPSVTMDLVHAIARAHADGVRLGAASAKAFQAHGAPAVSMPTGVVAVLTAQDGGVVATAADFECHVYSGFSLLEAQKLRVKRALATATIRAYCSEIIVHAIGAHHAQKICDDLVARNGFRREIIPVGHPA